MLKRILLVLALVFVGGAVMQPTESSAENLTWYVKSNYPHKVQIAFYSANRGHLWPDGGGAWNLNDYRTHRLSLLCVAGEKICFGAWVTSNSSKYWGVGFNNQHSCVRCCAICGAGSPPMQLLNP